MDVIPVDSFGEFAVCPRGVETLGCDEANPLTTLDQQL